MTTKEELNEVNSEINVLLQKKKKLENQLITETDSIIEKFLIWYNNDDECHYHYYPRQENFPTIYQAISDSDNYRRGETVDIERIIGDDNWELLMLSKDEFLKYFESEDNSWYEEEYQKVYDKYIPLIKEAMKGKIKSFKLDW